MTILTETLPNAPTNLLGANLPERFSFMRDWRPIPWDLAMLMSYFESRNGFAASYPRRSKARHHLVKSMEGTFYQIGPVEDRTAVTRWLIDNAVADLLIRLFFPPHMPLCLKWQNQVFERLRSDDLETAIFEALACGCTQQMTSEFFRLLEVVRGVTRAQFNAQVAELHSRGIVRIRSGRSGPTVTLISKRARAEGRVLRAELESPENRTRYTQREHIRGREAGWKTFLLGWVEALGGLRYCQATFDFFEHWSNFGGAVARTLIDEMVSAGQLRLCSIYGLPGVTI